MTANEIYTLALSFLSETPAGNETLEALAPGWISLLLQEALDQENLLRRFDGEKELTAAPQIRDLGEEIDYHPSILRVALPYGLASFFYIDDENDYRAQDFRARYISALEDTTRLREEPIVDCYGGDENA